MASAAALTTVQKLYIAYYGRPADAGGREYWASELDKAGGSLAGIINSFAGAAEAQALYGSGTTTADRVTVLYQNILGRTPDPQGLAYYAGEVDAGRLSLGSLALAILDGVQPTSDDAPLANNRLTVADAFTAQVNDQNYGGDAAAAIARTFLQQVTGDAATASQANGQLPAYLNTMAVATKQQGKFAPLIANGLLTNTAIVRADLTEDNLDAILSTLTNAAPTISGLPTTPQALTVGEVAALTDFNVADAEDDTLTVTLTANNGQLGGLTDADPNTAGIQLIGKAASINAALAGATFTANAVGFASVGIQVVDGVGATPTSGIYELRAGQAKTGAPVFTSPPGFAPKVDYTVGDSPESVSSADVNGDGKADLLVANRNFDGTVSVLTNKGDGSFSAQVDYVVGVNPSSVSSADVNGDGYPDLLVANFNSHTVSVLTNQGGGRFGTKVDYTVGGFANSVSSADVNGDGKPDLLVSVNIDRTNNGAISVLTNQGDGRFNAKVDYAVGVGPKTVSSADVNGDGKADLLVANRDSGTVTVLINQGDGRFNAQADYALGYFPRSISSADVNGDGKLDLVVAGVNGNFFAPLTTLSVLTNKGDGSFNGKVDYTVSGFGNSLSSADLNGDGYQDIVTVVNGSGVSVLTNQGDGRFNPEVDYLTGVANSVITADVNSDGQPDLLIANSLRNTVSIMTNLGLPMPTTFTEQIPVAVARNLNLRDPNGDADWDDGSLTIQIVTQAEVADRLSLPKSRPGNSDQGIWINPNSPNLALMAGDTQFGTASAVEVSQGMAWTFNFNAKATNARVQALVQAITFNNNSDAPGTETRQVRLTATDRGGLSGSTTVEVSVTAVNDAPTISGLSVDGASIRFTAADPDSSTLKAWVGSTELSGLAVSNGTPTTFTASAQATALSGELRMQDNAATPAATNTGLYLALGTAAADNLSSATSTSPAAVYGFGGNDTLAGGSQADTLSGGDGADVFDYRTYTDSTLRAYDQITDFATGLDKIKTGLTGGANSLQQGAAYTAATTGNLAADIANAVAAGNAAANRSKAANDVYVLTVTGQGAGYVYLDSNGDGLLADGELFIQLSGTSSTSLALADFIR